MLGLKDYVSELTTWEMQEQESGNANPFTR